MTTTPSENSVVSNLQDPSALLTQLIDTGISFGIDAIGALVILIIGWIAAGMLKRLTHKLLTRKDDADLMLASFLSRFVYYAVLAMVLIAVLGAFGIQTTSFAAMLGAAGLAIGLALQGTLSHVASGLMILAFRPFRIGHFVQTGGEEGTVKDITLFTTELTTVDNKKVIIPNGHVWDNTITNFSANGTRRLDLIFGISYDDDIDKAISVIEQEIAKDARIHADPAPLVAVDSLGDFSVNLTTRVWLASGDYFKVKCDLTKAVKEAFDRENVSIPYPTSVEYEGIWVDNQKKQRT